MIKYHTVLFSMVSTPGGGYMTCGCTGVFRPVFRKVPSSNYRKLPSYPLSDEFWRKTTHFLLFFANFLITHPCLWKICRKRDPSLENLGPKNPPIWAAHTRTLNMLCTPPPGGFQRSILVTMKGSLPATHGKLFILLQQQSKVNLWVARGT